MLLSKFKITGHSMEPSLLSNQIILASSLPFIFSKPKNGDIAVFKYKNKTYIKRIRKVKNSKYFLIGDNEKESIDSRKFGWISQKQILGKIVFKF